MNDTLTQALAKFIKHGRASTTLHFHKLHGVKHIVNLDWKCSHKAVQWSNAIITFTQIEEKKEGKE